MCPRRMVMLTPVLWMACASEPEPVAPAETVEQVPDQPEQGAEPTLAPTLSPTPEPEPEPEPAVDSWRGFPLWARTALPAEAVVPLPVGQVLVDAAAHPTGQWVLVLTRDADRDNLHWHRWELSGPLESIPGPELGELLPSELAWDPFDGGIYVIGERGGVAGIHRCESADASCDELLEVDGKLSGLRAPLARWDGKARVFCTLSVEGQRRVISVRRDGSGAYDLTHPTGRATELTDPDLRARVASGGRDRLAPRVLGVSDAQLIDVDAASGAVWLSTAGAVKRLDWSADGGNWSAVLTRAPGTSARAEQLRISPNGRLRVQVVDGSMRLVDRDGSELDRRSVPEDAQLVDLGPTGRCGLLQVPGKELRTACFVGRAAAIRYLDHVSPEAVPTLLAQGLAYRATPADGRASQPEMMTAFARGAPVLITLDDMMVWLRAGMEAVHFEHQRTRILPALRSFLSAVEAAAVDARTLRDARIGLHLLEHGLAGPHPDPSVEAELVRLRAEDAGSGRAQPSVGSAGRGQVPVDPQLDRLRRATEQVAGMTLTDAQRQALAADLTVVGTSQDWMAARAVFSMGTRGAQIFGTTARPPWVDGLCVPQATDRSVLPSSWGPDQEVIARMTASDHLPPECGVPQRQLPSGLDVMAALGSTMAESILLTTPPGRYPELPERLAALQARPLDAPGIKGSWLAIVRAFARAEGGPATVDEPVWQRRIMESGLVGWVDLRKPLPSVPVAGRLMDAGQAEQESWLRQGSFEQLQLEPAGPVIDPLPEAWTAIAESFALLSARVDHGNSDLLYQRLVVLEDLSLGLSEMATQQISGMPLSAERVDRIIARLDALERSARGGDSTDMRPGGAHIVDIHQVTGADGGSVVFHIARGRPRAITVLLQDRGVLVPAQGSVGAYHEVVAPGTLTDASWSTDLEAAARPSWLRVDP